MTSVLKRCEGVNCVLGERSDNGSQDARNVVGLVVVVLLLHYGINRTGDEANEVKRFQ